MITGFSIEEINGEKALKLYINYDEEFGMDFNIKHRYSSMKEEINKFLKKRKINFNGGKIVLVFGGIVLGVLLLTKPVSGVGDNDFVYVSDDIVSYTEVLDTGKNDVVIDEDVNIESNVVSESDTSSSSNVNTNTNVNTNNSNSTSSGNKGNNSNTTNSGNQNNNSVVDNNSSSVVEDSKPVESKQMVTIYRTNGTVISIDFDDYLVGVVGAEMPASFNVEALKAQAVIARTYALKRLSNNQKLTDSVSTQSYKDNNQLKKQWGNDYNKYYQKVRSAVDSTKNITVKYNGSYIDAVYHSTSNGRTEDAVNVWGNSVPYLRSVESSWDLSASSYLRVIDKDFLTVLNLFGLDLNSNPSIEILSRNNSGRISKIKIGEQVYNGVEFRNLLGLRSSDFDIEIVDGSIKITTRGYGHGVGMSQYGANGMANNGYNYQQIIKHYYQGVSI